MAVSYYGFIWPKWHLSYRSCLCINKQRVDFDLIAKGYVFEFEESRENVQKKLLHFILVSTVEAETVNL